MPPSLLQQATLIQFGCKASHRRQRIWKIRIEFTCLSTVPEELSLEGKFRLVINFEMNYKTGTFPGNPKIPLRNRKLWVHTTTAELEGHRPQRAALKQSESQQFGVPGGEPNTALSTIEKLDGRSPRTQTLTILALQRISEAHDTRSCDSRADGMESTVSGILQISFLQDVRVG